MEGNENPKRECEVLESVLISLIPALPAISRRGFSIIINNGSINLLSFPHLQKFII